MPHRIQRRRVAGWRKPPGAVAVDRTTRWGNPHPVAVKGDPASHAVAVALYHQDVERDADLRAAIQRELRGRVLMCWCPLSLPCHADVLLKIANA